MIRGVIPNTRMGPRRGAGGGAFRDGGTRPGLRARHRPYGTDPARQFSMARTLLLLLALLPVACHGLGGDFRLTDHEGEPFSLSDARGDVVVMGFGFTHCPDVCPVMLASVAASLRALGPRAGQVTPLFVTLDPARDTPARLKEYVTWFHPRIRGLTGSAEDIAQVAGQYNVRYSYDGREDGDGDYSVDHTSSIYVIGRDGQLVRMVPHGVPAEVLTNALDHALSRDRSNQPEE